MHAKLLQSCSTLCTLWTAARETPLFIDSPGKNTGVACHALPPEDLPELRKESIKGVQPQKKTAELRVITGLPKDSRESRNESKSNCAVEKVWNTRVRRHKFQPWFQRTH